jgi:hypothetical protein
VRGLAQLIIDLANQILVQRKDCHRADAEADNQQQAELTDEQPGAERLGASSQV